MTWGSLAPPLGNTRLHVVKLLASALSANDMALTQELLALDVPSTLLVCDKGWAGREDGLGAGAFLMLACPPQDLFFHYVFNNFLHTQVEMCVSAMLSSGPPAESSPETPPSNPVVTHVSQGPAPQRPPYPFRWCFLGDISCWQHECRQAESALASHTGDSRD